MTTKLAASITATLIAAQAAAVAAAQDAPRASLIEEIVVTAQKREESLQDVPISITVFTAEALEKNMIGGLSDYFDRTPNVSVSNNGNRARSQVSIRGVGNIGGRANSFGVYVDEFNIAPTSSIRTYDPNLIDVERVEVLRGPQGTYFGRNATGGALSIVTRKPGDTFAFDGALDIGRYGSRLVRGAADVPLTSTLAIRASGYFEESDGYVKNIGPSGGTSDLEAHGERLAVRYRPTEDFTLDLVASNISYDHGSNAMVLRDPVTLGVPERPWTTNVNAAEFTENSGQIYTARLEYDFGRAALVSVTGYIDNHYQEFSDQDARPVALRIQDSHTQLRSFSQELRLQSSDAERFDWLVGVMYAEDSLSGRGRRDFEAAAGGANIFDNLQVEETTMYAAFADATWHATDLLSFTLGGRYTKSNYDRHDINVQAGVTTQSGLLEQDDSDFSPRFVFTQEWTDALTTYVSVSKGFKAGAASGIVPPGANPLFSKETLWSYEAGAKAALFDGRLRLNAAAFFMDWKDLQVFATPDPSQLLFFVQNAAKATSRGAELELFVEPVEGLELTANLGYLDAQFDDFPNASSGNSVVDLSGYRLPFAPEWTAGATAQYSIPLGNWRGFARTEWNHVDSMFRDPDTDFIFQTAGVRTFIIPERDVVNFRVGVNGERYGIVAYVENALEEEYYTGVRGTTLVDPHPRQYGVRLTAHFR